MPVRNALCIAVDGLRASALGAYGNTWYLTPALDALAGQSQVFDWMWSDSPTPDGFYKSVWSYPPPSKGGARGGIPDVSHLERPGVEPTIPNPSPSLSPQGRGMTLAATLAAGGVETALTTDDRWTAEQAEAAGFSEVRYLEIRSQQSAATVDETELAQLFAVAVDQLQTWTAAGEGGANVSRPRLLWLHARGFHGAWDAPLELRQSLLEEDDPPAPMFVTPPDTVAADDHDALLLYRAAYAAQAMVLDQCLGALLAALAEFGLDRETLVMLVGCRGYALGEHGAVGGDVRKLYSELLHVPCLVRMPDVAFPPLRSSQFVLPIDSRATLAEWFGAATSGLPPWAVSLLSPPVAMRVPGSRQYIVARGDHGEGAIRTPAWMLRKAPIGAGDAVDPPPSSIELYVKPDDRWEANEVADRLPEVALRLLAALDRETSAEDGAASPRDWEPLDDELLTPAR